ncbi:general transcription factor 3C polypeptide 5 isoform X2 [Betta splendens]|uniref:General transcription factor 3C polypeptide 5 isoform X2 n=1 Tax=Betta splendens TaxID=158456 RepID=A0A6P7P418_BETSP|nr:general transcription factor 3C polypeptide 5 isoform X2 [Betta splendens]
MEVTKTMKLGFSLKELSLSRCTGDVPGGSSTVELRDSRLVCVEYPAVIKSVDKVLETLGGEQTVSKTFAHPNRRLELHFRPQDPFCHSLYGNRFSSSNLLLRVRRRVRKTDPKDVKIRMDVLGVIGTTYKFQGLADFQCLAVHSEKGENTSLYDKIILQKPENQEFFEQPVPSFLPPAIFSRLDSPVDYFYRPDVQHQSVTPGQVNKKNVIGLTRARRPNNAIFVSFSDPTVPSECLEAAKQNWARICLKDADKEAEEKLKEMFERRPIWSRNAVKANVNLHPDKMKLLLPVFAYYMVTGPWRSLWVRLGYDPRQAADSKKYQMLDFRIRCSGKHGYSLSDMPVKAKRSALNYSLPNTLNKAVPQPASVMGLPAQEGPSTSREPAPVTHQLKESSYIFREGMLPPHRQMFYQLCDLHVESIQQVIEQNSGSEQACDERDGWCVLGTTDKLRDMISGMIKKVVQAQKPAMPEAPTRRRRRGLSSNFWREAEEADEEDEEEEEDDDEEFLPSEGSENEMETEILDYM